MAVLTPVTIAWQGAFPTDDIVSGQALVAVNNDEFNRLTVNIDGQYRNIKLIAATIQSAAAATVPAFSQGEHCALSIRRGLVNMIPPITSRRTILYGETDENPDGVIWNFDPRDFLSIPSIYPGDQMLFNVPPIDDNVTPLGDINYYIQFYIIKY